MRLDDDRVGAPLWASLLILRHWLNEDLLAKVRFAQGVIFDIGIEILALRHLCSILSFQHWLIF